MADRPINGVLYILFDAIIGGGSIYDLIKDQPLLTHRFRRKYIASFNIQPIKRITIRYSHPGPFLRFDPQYPTLIF